MRPLWAFSSEPLNSTRILRWPTGECRNHITAKRSEEHTSELQSQSNLVCRLLLEKNKRSHSNLRGHCRVVRPCGHAGPPQHILLLQQHGLQLEKLCSCH